jgi:hypothetical protein
MFDKAFRDYLVDFYQRCRGKTLAEFYDLAVKKFHKGKSDPDPFQLSSLVNRKKCKKRL